MRIYEYYFQNGMTEKPLITRIVGGQLLKLFGHNADVPVAALDQIIGREQTQHSSTDYVNVRQLPLANE
jgi:hypothetical protein